MKKYILVLCLLPAFGLAHTAWAQNVSIHINIDNQPAWGPIGYDYVEFYYFPDINVYYDIDHSLFYYPSRRAWIASEYLPYKYHIYDLYGMYKVVINDTPQPWLYNKTHKRMYSMYRGDRTQIAIRYSTNNRYNSSRDRDSHWVRPDDYPHYRPSINHSDDRRPSSDRGTISRPNNQNRPDRNRPDRPNNSNRPNDSNRPSSSSGESSGRR